MKPRTNRAKVFAVAATLLLVGCLEALGGTADGPTATGNFAALTLGGVSDATWDREVVNGTSAVARQQRVASSRFGDGRGSAGFLGPADATLALSANSLRLRVAGVYSFAVRTLGAFGGAPPGGSLAFESPTPVDAGSQTWEAPLTQGVVRVENADRPVRFDVSLMRPTGQGFLDIAVSFHDIHLHLTNPEKADGCGEHEGEPVEVGSRVAAEEFGLLDATATGELPTPGDTGDPVDTSSSAISDDAPVAPAGVPGGEVEEPDRERVALHTDWADNEAEEAAVTFGVPFARGALPDVSRARIVDSGDRVVPAQIEATATWDGPDGPVRWALVHTRLRRDRGYFLEYGREVTAHPPQGVQIEETGGAILINSGPMRFVISRTVPSVIHSAALQGDGAGDIVTPEQSAAALPVVEDGNGVIYEASSEALSVEVVEHGPQRATVRREGWYVGPDGTRFCQFITYTYFQAGDAGFRHDHTLVVAFDTHHHQIRDVLLPLPLNLEGNRRTWFATDDGPDGSLLEQVAGGESLSLVQSHHRAWTLHRADELLAEGERSGGWFGLADSTRGAFAGIEHFWQNYPAELEVADNRLHLHLHASRETPPLDFNPSEILGRRGEKYPGERVFASRWYRDGLNEMTQGFGVGKTHTLTYRFFSEPDRQAAARAARTLNKPIIAYADPEWASRSEAFGRVHHYDPEAFPQMEAIIDAIVHRRHWLRERLENYGWFHFGDINGNLHEPGDPENVTFNHWRRWASMFYGNPNVMPHLFMRSGRRDAWDFHRVNTRHITDIDIGHLDSDEFKKWKGGRYGGDGGIVHFAANQYGLGPDSHLRFMHYDYYLNGNLRTWEVAHYYTEAYAALRGQPANLFYRHRATGGSLRMFSEAYQATWNPEYLDIMRQFANILYETKEDRGVTRYDDVYMNEGKVLYYQLTGDERMRDLFLSDMHILRQRRDAHVFVDSRHTTLWGLSHAYWLTGDRAFLPFALWQLDVARERMITEGDPGLIGSVDWALEFAYLATLGNQLPTMMAAMVHAGEPLPGPEGPNSFASGALHFLQEEDGPVEIAVNTLLYSGVARPFRNWREWMERLEGEDRPALALIGPDGTEVERVYLDESESGGALGALPSHHGGDPPSTVSFLHPADGQTGVYTVQPASLAVPLRLGISSSNLERFVMDPREGGLYADGYLPYHFQVPAGTGKFTVRVKSAALRGEHELTVRGQEGEVIAAREVSGGPRNWVDIELDAGGPAQDQVWRLHAFPQMDRGLYVQFDRVPGYLGFSAQALFDPGRAWTAPLFANPPQGDGPAFRTEPALGGAPAADLPANTSVRIPLSLEESPDPSRGAVELWVLCHRRPDEVRDRTLVSAGDVRLLRRADIGTYILGFQTGFVLPPGRWTHLAATWTPLEDGRVEVALFADGVYVESNADRRMSAPESWPGEAMVIPAGEAGLSIAGLRLSRTARHDAGFPAPTAPFRPDEDTLALWPSNTEGDVWVPGTETEPPVTGGTETEPPVTGSTETEAPATGGTETEAPPTGGTETEPPVTGGMETEPPVTGGMETEPPVTGGTETEPPVTGASGAEDSDETSVTILPCDEPREVRGRMDEDETWTARPSACPAYLVTGDVELRALLTIEPGVVVRFEAGTRLVVARASSSGLLAEGTAAKPIVFEGSHSEPGWWRGLSFFRQHARNRLDHVIIRHAGGGDATAAIRVGGSRIERGDLRMTNTRVEQSASLGLRVNRWGTLAGFADNTFEANEGSPLEIDVSQLAALDHGTSWGEDTSIEVIGRHVGSGLTLLGLEAPYHLQSGLELQGPVEVEAGAVLRFASGTRLTVGRQGGSLRAEGTADSPIVIEGTQDEAGWWRGVEIFNEHALNRLDHVVLRHAGGGDATAAIRVGGSRIEHGDIRITNSRIQQSASRGLHVTRRGTLVSFADNSFEDLADHPVRVHANQLDRFGPGNEYGDAAMIEVTGGRIDEETELRDPGAPLLLLGNLSVRAALTIHAGTTLLLTRDTRIETESGGYIEALGVEGDPISIAGSTATAGWWEGLVLAREGARPNVFKHVEFLHAGGGTGDAPAAIVAGSTRSRTGHGRNVQVVIANSFFDEIGDPGANNATAVRTASDTRGSFNEDVCTANTFGTIHGPVECDYP